MSSLRLDDGGDLRKLKVDLDAAARTAPDEVHKVTQKGALNIKNEWRRRWSGHPKIAQAMASISYDSEQRGTQSRAEIGPERTRRRGAALANLIEFEYGSRWSAPIPGGKPALDLEEPRYIKALESLAEKSLGR